MKNLLSAVALTTLVILLCGSAPPPTVSSISFDGGKTKLTGDVVVNFHVWRKGRREPVYPVMFKNADQAGQPLNVDLDIHLEDQ